MKKYHILSNDEQITRAIVTQLKADEWLHFEDVQSLIKAIPYQKVLVCDFNCLPQLKDYLNEIIQRDIACIGIYSDRSQITVKTLLEYGIVAAFHISECSIIPHYCESFTGIVSGTVGIVDSNQINLWGLSTLIKKFGYSALVYADLDECCKSSVTVDILCINCSQISTEKIAKTYISGMLPKKNAIVLYKSDEKDIYIHDIIKLNRLAKVIYILEEVYSMLVHLLFTQQVHAYIYKLYDIAHMHSTTTSYRGTLRQWYMEAGTAIFDTPDIMNSEVLEEFGKDIRMLDTLRARAQAFSWMVNK